VVRIFILFIIIYLTQPFSYGQLTNADVAPKLNDEAVEVEVVLELYKIFNINSVDQTFEVDGYLICSWKDERMKYTEDSIPYESLKYCNERFDNITTDQLWCPKFEFINTNEARTTSNRSIEIRPDGTIIYLERFNASLYQQMDYNQFPFDHQHFVINMESFSDVERDVRFIVNKNNGSFRAVGKEGTIKCPSWTITNPRAEVVSVEGGFETENSSNSYSRVKFIVDAERMSGFYIWQLLFPLAIIILASVVIFWIDDFGLAVEIGFTLMLTVVAYNFYSGSFLPQLPYNTYIEVIIMLGYVFILLAIVATVHNNYSGQKDDDKAKKHKLFYRYFYPITFLFSILVTTLYFYA